MISMPNIRSAVTRTLIGGALLASTAACSEKFFEVTNPNLIDASTVDPTTTAPTLAASAQQNFAYAYGLLIHYSAYFTDEMNVSDTFPTRNEFGLRTVSDLNGTLNSEVWAPLSVAAASTKTVLDLALPSPTTNINLARAATFRGFATLFMATDFCTGTLSGGPELTTAALLDTAIFWFDRANTVGRANASTDAVALANAALVGRARAKLQKGDNTGALTDANAVPAGFVFNLNYTDDLANRNRLGNREWIFTFDRGGMSVPVAFQIQDGTGAKYDPRVQWKGPTEHKLQPQDQVPGGYFIQQKYTAYNSPIRLASRLEADYIAAEASGSVTQQLALIAARRAANGQGAYAGATDANSVLTELFDQRAREFWLEGKRLADFRRHPTNTNYVPASGSVYVKPGYANIGTQTCYPIPRVERDNNPNFHK
ncbi:MAG: hypothetical protein JWN79_990 [Gemmatimonadetes bacterium]|jgi:hypothetical protein|nr:hypothetical protein [Gemmatimonadota bacterium]